MFLCQHSSSRFACAWTTLLIASACWPLSSRCETVFPAQVWLTRECADVGLDPAKLELFAQRVGGDGCVIRDGNMVKSWGNVAGHKDWASAAKPVLSTLLMLAVEEGKLPSVDAKVKDFDWELSAKDSAMTFRQLANMVSGYALDEAPGEAWGYNDYAIQLYAKSLERVFKQPLDQVLRERLAPLQLEDGEFFGSRNGAGVTASPRDFARLGWLWFNRGRWANRQLISEKLFAECVRVGVPADLPRAKKVTNDYLKIGSYGGGTDQTPSGPGVYGFNLWFNEMLSSGQRVWPALPADAYQANGLWNRDTLTVIPSLRMVVASRAAKPGKFEPGVADGEYNQNLKLLAEAVISQTSVNSNAQTSKTVEVDRWQPHDFSFKSSEPVENPFRVRFTATVNGPSGDSFELPGFYDGAGVWKVRVSGSSEGSWSLRTHSDLPALEGRSADFKCVANSNAKVHGTLRIDPRHPRHFLFEDGQRFYMLGYECDWLWSLDFTDPKLPTVNSLLDKVAEHGFNYVILNSYAHDTTWRPGKSGDDDYGPPPAYAWEGTNEQPDHGRLNVAYWQHYDRVIEALHQRGIMAHILLKVYNKKVKWPERGSAEDDLFFRSMIARYAAYPNVLWDFSKEAHNEKDLQYKLVRLRFVRAGDPYQHLITVHDDNANYDAGAFDGVADYRSDQQHSKFRETLLAQRQLRAWPVANVEFGYEHGPDGPNDKTYRAAQAPEEFVRRAWEIAMAGGYTAYYYTYTAWDVLRPAHTPRGYAYFKLLKDFFESTRYWELEPTDGISSAGWALANPGLEYVVYVDRAQRVSISLPDSPLPYASEWFHPLTGRRVKAGQLKPGKQDIEPPSDWTGPAVLHVKPEKLASIDVSGFYSSIHHWRDLRDGSRFIQVIPNQPSYEPSQVREIVENILLFQRANGGWPKDYDMLAILSEQQRAKVVETHGASDSSYDNGNLHSQVDYLARAVAQTGHAKWRAACERGFDFLLRSQYPNGGIPQRFPNATSYHAHITFNDGVMIGALEVLRDAAESKPHFAWLDAHRRQQAADAVKRGVNCILRCQIVVDGVKTGWCQQHDENTFEARPARTFELASICPQESTEIVRFLMQEKNPSAEIVAAIDSAVDWLTKVGLSGIRVEKVKSTTEEFLRHTADFDTVIVADSRAKPLWARHYEIGTNRPIFAGRDGVKKYSLSEIERERRTGTAWYGGWPDSLLKAARHNKSDAQTYAR